MNFWKKEKCHTQNKSLQFIRYYKIFLSFQVKVTLILVLVSAGDVKIALVFVDKKVMSIMDPILNLKWRDILIQFVRLMTRIKLLDWHDIWSSIDAIFGPRLTPILVHDWHQFWSRFMLSDVVFWPSCSTSDANFGLTITSFFWILLFWGLNSERKKILFVEYWSENYAL